MPRTGTPSSNTASGARGGVASVTDSGPPDRMIPRAPKARTALVAAVPGQDLAVDADLAHAPRDQLRVLRAEVEDQDPVGMDVGRSGLHLRRHQLIR